MNEIQPQKELSTKRYLPLLVAVLVLLIGAFLFFRYIKHKEVAGAREQEEAALHSSFLDFVTDTITKNVTDQTIKKAIDIKNQNPSSKEGKACSDWLFNRKINEQEFLRRYDDRVMKYADSVYQTGKDEVTTPADDEMHEKAFVTAKDFVKEKLKAPSTADFQSNYSWGKIGYDETYVISGTVDAQNSFGTMLREKWSVKLKFNGGDWMDDSNWTLLDITVD